MWVQKWKQCSELVPERMVDALQQCDEIQFTIECWDVVVVFSAHRVTFLLKC